jgi:hypothetical protein
MNIEDRVGGIITKPGTAENVISNADDAILGSLPNAMYSRWDDESLSHPVSRFGDLWINAC